jgi:proteasome lid subunit RPN8/RPN11
MSSGSLNSDFLGSGGGATDASGERINMDAMNQEAWNNRRDRMDKAFLKSLGNGSINLPVTPIEAIRDDPKGVQRSWDRFLLNSNPTIDKGGFIDNKGEFIGFMTDQAKNNPVEVAAFGLNDGRFFVQPWINNTVKFSDNDFSHPSLKGLTITSQYHTHPNGSGLSHKDAMFSQTYRIPVHSISPNGDIWRYNHADYRKYPNDYFIPLKAFDWIPFGTKIN